MAAREATAALAAHDRRHAAAVERSEEIELAIDALERDGEQLGTQRTRLEAQMKTVIAPREAEALMHELSTIAARRDGLDDQELLASFVRDVRGADAGEEELALLRDALTAGRVAEVSG